MQITELGTKDAESSMIASNAAMNLMSPVYTYRKVSAPQTTQKLSGKKISSPKESPNHRVLPPLRQWTEQRVKEMW
jgi:hypothetical protein